MADFPICRTLLRCLGGVLNDNVAGVCRIRTRGARSSKIRFDSWRRHFGFGSTMEWACPMARQRVWSKHEKAFRRLASGCASGRYAANGGMSEAIWPRGLPGRTVCGFGRRTAGGAQARRTWRPAGPSALRSDSPAAVHGETSFRRIGHGCEMSV